MSTANKFIFTIFFLGCFYTNIVTASNIEMRTTFVHLFEWPWNDIAKECEEFLGPNGFSAIQVSPPNEHAVLNNREWYERYQPVSYKLISRSGNEQEFREMVRRCKNVGVDIYVDAVINHMTWIPSMDETKYGIGGTHFSYYSYNNLYSIGHFHKYNGTSDSGINDYQNRFEVQNGNVALCADLATENPYVQSKIRDYLLKLQAIGVKGIRIDAAKHIPSHDISSILYGVSDDFYVFQEVIDHGNEPIKSREYFVNGDVTEFNYSKSINDIFITGKLAWLKNFGESWGFMPSNKAVVFIDNHDTQRHSDNRLNYKAKQLYFLANAFMLAYPYGYPKVLSSYPFSDFHQGPPSDYQGKTLSPMKYPNYWNFEHRHQYVYQMIRFKNKTNRKFYITNWWSNNNNQIAFGRDDLGFFILNKEPYSLEATLQTNLEPGLYRDLLSDNHYFIDKNRKIKISLPPFRAMAILKKD